MGNAEQPDYTLVKLSGNIEIRDYLPMVVAEVAVHGERKEAISQGFKILADYIFGNNTSRKNHELSEKIAMTAPVLQQRDVDQWRVRFVMPKKYRLEALPQPNSKEITLIPFPARRFAVITFSNLADNASIEQHTEELKKYMVSEKLEKVGEPILAFYNPPWTLPFLRRNEIMMEIGIVR